MTGSPRHACDVLILGAGPSGCATALGLLAAGVERVLLVDRPAPLPFRIGESAAPAVADLLAQLGLEHRLERLGHSPYHGNLSQWGSDQPQADHFLFHGRRNGWHLDRAAFDAWLRREAVARKAQLVSPAQVDGIAAAPAGWTVQVRGMGSVAARALVDASGRRAALTARLGVRRRRIDGLLAMATHAGAAPRMAGMSLVESFADGWWYAAGLPDGRTLVTLMTDADVAKAQGYTDAATLLQAWRATRLLSHYVEAPDAAPAVHGFGAQSGFIEHAAGDRWLAVGDALMGFDPLTSAGIAGALHDAVAAVPAILGQLDGDTAGARDYTLRAESMLRRFLSERDRHYGNERRWGDRVFWARRTGNARSGGLP